MAHDARPGDYSRPQSTPPPRGPSARAARRGRRPSYRRELLAGPAHRRRRRFQRRMNPAPTAAEHRRAERAAFDIGRPLDRQCRADRRDPGRGNRWPPCRRRSAGATSARRRRRRRAAARPIWLATASSAARTICARARAERQAEDRAARIGPPVRRAEPGEGRDDLHPAAVGDRARQRLAFRRRARSGQAASRSHWIICPATNNEPSSA